MNTNKFLLGGLVAIIAIVSVQITNQLQIQDLIEKIDSVAIPQQAAVITATQTTTPFVSPLAPAESNPCIATTTTINQGIGATVYPSKNYTLQTTCDTQSVKITFMIFAKNESDLANITLTEKETGVKFPVALDKTRKANDADLENFPFFTTGTVDLKQNTWKNGTQKTYTFNTTKSVAHVLGYVETASTTKTMRNVFLHNFLNSSIIDDTGVSSSWIFHRSSRWCKRQEANGNTTYGNMDCFGVTWV